MDDKKAPFRVPAFPLKLAAALLGLYLLILATHGVWLPWAGSWLRSSETTQLKHAGLIVVSTGSYSRFRHALDLYRRGLGDRLLLLGDRRYRMVPAGRSTLGLAEEEALDEGVERNRLIVRHSTSTRDDARGTEKVMREFGLGSALVVTDRYNLRRLIMIFDRVFQGTPLQLMYTSPAPRENLPGRTLRWWESPGDFVFVIKEWIKMPVNFFLMNFSGA